MSQRGFLLLVASKLVFGGLVISWTLVRGGHQASEIFPSSRPLETFVRGRCPAGIDAAGDNFATFRRFLPTSLF